PRRPRQTCATVAPGYRERGPRTRGLSGRGSAPRGGWGRAPAMPRSPSLSRPGHARSAGFAPATRRRNRHEVWPSWSSGGSLLGLDLGRDRGGAGGEAECEGGPLADAALGAEAAMVGLDDVAADGKAQAGPPQARVVGAVLGGEERIEDVPQVGRRNPDPRV